MAPIHPIPQPLCCGRGNLGPESGWDLPEFVQQVWSHVQTGTSVSQPRLGGGRSGSWGCEGAGQLSDHMSVHLSPGWVGSKHSVTSAPSSLGEGDASKKKSGQISMGLAVAHTANGTLGGALWLWTKEPQQHSHGDGWLVWGLLVPSQLPPSSTTPALLQPLQVPRG